MFRNQDRENRRQEHENQRLHKSHQHFQKIKWNRQDRRETWIHGRHRFENAFAGINVPEQSKAKRDWSKQNRDHFKPSHSEENDNHKDLNYSGGLPFGSEQMF